ncbi:winged helix-turn-helix domain-containing protein [Lysobacter sp. CA196]|uniref:winged helix-turn-helix domain-containing protein n=1 Tax=Lysobacter sp. CA196 TaxID=3455606 RepID=UPI003F8D86A9
MPWPTDTRYLRTGELVVDLRNRLVTIDGADVELQQRVFDLLMVLLAEPHTLHSRAQLFESLWPNVVVEEANLSHCIWVLRKALGDDRKSWIRTVSKGGYICEPPGPVEALTTLHAPGAAATTDAATPSLPAQPAELIPDTAPDATTFALTAAPSRADAVGSLAPSTSYAAAPASSERRRRWAGWAIGASIAAAFAAIVLIGWRLKGERALPAVAATSQAQIIAVIEVEDPAAANRWPVKLLRQWLTWKLTSLPELTVLNEAELAADASATSPTSVFISASSVSNDARLIVLRARFQGAPGGPVIEVRGTHAEVPAMVDTLSRRVMTRLVPTDAENWPALALDAATARRYADAIDAYERRDWMATAAISSAVAARAPRFGLVRWQLAKAQSFLSQAPAAIENMQAAYALLQPAPARARELLDAQRLAIDPEPQQQLKATRAYGRLAARYPHNAAIALTHASLQLTSGEEAQAMKTLASPNWEREPIGTRIERLLALSSAYRSAGDPARAMSSAQAAQRLSRDAGLGWELQQAAALLTIATINDATYEKPAPAQFEEAAALFEAGGDHTAALYARFRAEAARPPAAGSGERFDALLAKARAGGYRKLELEILMRIAKQHRDGGDIDQYRAYLVQALAVAEVSAPAIWRNHLQMVVTNQDLMLARYDRADARVERLRGAGLQGHAALLLARLEADLAMVRGRYAQALAVLDSSERRLIGQRPDESGITEAQITLACTRMWVRLPMGDLQGTRTDMQRCKTSKHSNWANITLLMQARTARLAGDRDAAHTQLAAARAALAKSEDDSDRWALTLTATELLTRLGDIDESDRVYRQLLPKLQRSGYAALIAGAETGLAENAAARGDWVSSRAHIAAARGMLPTNEWLLSHRLDMLKVADSWSHGDRERTVALATPLHARAHALGDAVAQMELHSLLPLDVLAEVGGAVERERLIARTGMRGAKMEWLKSVALEPVGRSRVPASVAPEG